MAESRAKKSMDPQKPYQEQEKSPLINEINMVKRNLLKVFVV